MCGNNKGDIIKEKTFIIIGFVVAILLTITIGLGLYYDNISDLRVDDQEPEIVTPTPVPTVVPTPAPAPIPTTNNTTTINGTQNASQMYNDGIYGSGSSSSAPLNPIPELSSFVLVGIGLIGLWLVLRCK